MMFPFTLSAALFEYSVAVWLLACCHAWEKPGANTPKSSAVILPHPSLLKKGADDAA